MTNSFFKQTSKFFLTLLFFSNFFYLNIFFFHSANNFMQINRSHDRGFIKKALFLNMMTYFCNNNDLSKGNNVLLTNSNDLYDTYSNNLYDLIYTYDQQVEKEKKEEINDSYSKNRNKEKRNLQSNSSNANVTNNTSGFIFNTTSYAKVFGTQTIDLNTIYIPDLNSQQVNIKTIKIKSGRIYAITCDEFLFDSFYSQVDIQGVKIINSQRFLRGSCESSLSDYLNIYGDDVQILSNKTIGAQTFIMAPITAQGTYASSYQAANGNDFSSIRNGFNTNINPSPSGQIKLFPLGYMPFGTGRFTIYQQNGLRGISIMNLQNTPANYSVPNNSTYLALNQLSNTQNPAATSGGSKYILAETKEYYQSRFNDIGMKIMSTVSNVESAGTILDNVATYIWNGITSGNTNQINNIADLINTANSDLMSTLQSILGSLFSNVINGYLVPDIDGYMSVSYSCMYLGEEFNQLQNWSNDVEKIYDQAEAIINVINSVENDVNDVLNTAKIFSWVPGVGTVINEASDIITNVENIVNDITFGISDTLKMINQDLQDVLIFFNSCPNGQGSSTSTLKCCFTSTGFNQSGNSVSCNITPTPGKSTYMCSQMNVGKTGITDGNFIKNMETIENASVFSTFFVPSDPGYKIKLLNHNFCSIIADMGDDAIEWVEQHYSELFTLLNTFKGLNLQKDLSSAIQSICPENEI